MQQQEATIRCRAKPQARALYKGVSSSSPKWDLHNTVPTATRSWFVLIKAMCISRAFITLYGNTLRSLCRDKIFQVQKSLKSMCIFSHNTWFFQNLLKAFQLHQFQRFLFHQNKQALILFFTDLQKNACTGLSTSNLYLVQTLVRFFFKNQMVAIPALQATWSLCQLYSFCQHGMQTAICTQTNKPRLNKLGAHPPV